MLRDKITENDSENTVSDTVNVISSEDLTLIDNLPSKGFSLFSSKQPLNLVLKTNKHCRQSLFHIALPYLAKDPVCFKQFTFKNRILGKDEPTMKYKKRPDKWRSTLHWGQLKLLECEITLLMIMRAIRAILKSVACKGKSVLVVYAGAAPGEHIPILAEMFPTYDFHCYDPASYCNQLKNYALKSVGRIILTNGYFDKECANKYVERCDNKYENLVFISDIRTADPRIQSDEIVENCIEKDMFRQKEWCLIINPDISMLKFRLPWKKGVTEYLSGKILKQTFAPTTSTESRLIITRDDLNFMRDNGLTKYDNQTYEMQLMYHNTITRSYLYNHPIKNVPGLDHCYDCTSLVLTMKNYYQSSGCNLSDEQLSSKLTEFINGITNNGRDLATRYRPSSTRQKNQFSSRIHIDKNGNDKFQLIQGSRSRNRGRSRGRNRGQGKGRNRGRGKGRGGRSRGRGREWSRNKKTT